MCFRSAYSVKSWTDKSTKVWNPFRTYVRSSCVHTFGQVASASEKQEVCRQMSKYIFLPRTRDSSCRSVAPATSCGGLAFSISFDDTVLHAKRKGPGTCACRRSKEGEDATIDTANRLVGGRLLTLKTALVIRVSCVVCPTLDRGEGQSAESESSGKMLSGVYSHNFPHPNESGTDHDNPRGIGGHSTSESSEKFFSFFYILIEAGVTPCCHITGGEPFTREAWRRGCRRGWCRP